MSEPKAFIIHLERSAQRRPQVERLRAALPCASEILDATDGALLAPNETDRVYGRRCHRPLYPFALNRGEIGVFLSHRAVWRRILAEGLDYALVFEDDAAIDPNSFARTFALARETRKIWSYALAPSEKTPVRGEILARGEGVALIRPENPPLRAIAQFVSAEAARRLLAVTEKFDRPVDTFLQMSWVTGVELLAFQPSGVRDASAGIGGSTIQAKKKPLPHRLARETLRPLYRAQVRLWHAFARRPGF
ncbi:glycosyltransferase family 25 protein [Rhodoblastus acidophilus]|uniref:Glycosyltransferase family 25 protein n=1 Tax=Candidatus Rhodoblastus alkanivorans TaxID=2954117 RepID=A0ABS9Z6K3_9HYPH|nr:glycosyltransferase family 25 protein [Candidatus Rhodoblastus alkanivorans]MCI4679692.1 glycosyltransferase family 25 protein [Candidatus Rhodoblastus alkanivorans]MCI4683246.1 glycosyltransferase family 25 protein [Candidatus Rhodoblastus alkanivorans]MDI4640558.1 glycosyltransferase family 25 protein [Rhodoblastus acidophilus]